MTLSILAIITLSIWVYLALFRAGFWRGKERLPPAPDPDHWPDVCVIIPARNEAQSIQQVIEAHMASDYAGTLSITLVDDHSTDATAERARAGAAATGQGRRNFELISAGDLPPGWTGKLWALNAGLEQLEKTGKQPKYVLFTDADILLAPDTLSRITAKAEAENLSLVSLMARLDARGFWGALLVPAFVYFFQKLYPFPRANDPMENLAAAAGGCMLIRKSALDDVGGLHPIRNELIDDCALARSIKNRSASEAIWLGLSTGETVSLRDNRKLASIWNMVARTAFAQLNHSTVLLAGTVTAMLLIYIAPVVFAFSFAAHGNIPVLMIALSSWGIMAGTYWPTLKLYGQEPWQSIALPLASLFFTAMTISSALRHYKGRGGEWKGRFYSNGAARS